MSWGVRGIVKRMRHIYQQYKFVKYLQEDIKAFEAKHDFLQEMEYRLKPVSKVIKREYAAKTGMSRLDVSDIVDSCMMNDFIDVYQDNDKEKTRHLFVSAKEGQDLLDRIWIFPLGLWREWLSAYGTLFGFLTGGLVAAMAIYLGKFAWHLGAIIISLL